MPNFRFRLPSRNWLIFLSVTGSWTAAVLYDRHHRKKNQQKWCDLVAHISQNPLEVKQMPRKLTVFLSAPPGDGIRTSRQYFKEYVKPVLVAAAMDYDVIEGRKEGDVRYGTAEQIRRFRRKKGETGPTPKEEQQPDTELIIDTIREAVSIRPEPGVRGDLVLGRHTWKEYIRGLHEGWLGPVEEPLPPPPPPQADFDVSSTPLPTEPPLDEPAATDAPTETVTEPEKKEEQKKEEKKKPSPPHAYLSISQYASSCLSPNIPSELEPSQAIHQQHILGFLKFPIRIYNFLNRRHLADQIGRETAAIVLAANRPYEQSSTFASPMAELDTSPIATATRAPENDADEGSVQTGQTWEQQTMLGDEEHTWHKSVRKPRKDDDETEVVWMKEVVIDPRLGERMRRFMLDPEEEARATRLLSGEEKSGLIPVQDLRAQKPVFGNLEDEDA